MAVPILHRTESGFNSLWRGKNSNPGCLRPQPSPHDTWYLRNLAECLAYRGIQQWVILRPERGFNPYKLAYLYKCTHFHRALTHDFQMGGISNPMNKAVSSWEILGPMSVPLSRHQGTEKVKAPSCEKGGSRTWQTPWRRRQQLVTSVLCIREIVPRFASALVTMLGTSP